MTTMDDLVFLEAMSRVHERDFLVLGVGFLTVRLWRQLPADRLNPEQVRAIESTLRATDDIPDTWQFARTALREALEAVTAMESDAVVQTALARYAAGIARLAPDVGTLILTHLRNSPARPSAAAQAEAGYTLRARIPDDPRFAR